MSAHLNRWQAERMAELMAEHEDPTEDALVTSYATVTNVIAADGERLVVIMWEDGHKRVLFHDGQDVTEDYPHIEGEATPRRGES